MTTGIYAGSFDPLTLGHYSVISQATQVFDKVIVAVGVNSSKAGLFSADERMSLIRSVVEPLNNVRVVSFNGLFIQVDMREALQSYLKGKRGSSVPSVRALVRGHLKLQPHGPKNSLRKVIWRKPYWSRGLDGSPIAKRTVDID